jgi:hypothetical protein
VGEVPPAVVTACRYVRDSETTLRLDKQVTDRPATEARRAVAETLARALPGTSLECVYQAGVSATVDVLILRDVLGQTVEVRVLRDACGIVFAGPVDYARSDAGLLGVLDALLGPPA